MSRDPSKTGTQKRKKARTGLVYTAVFLGAALLSFGGGFWFTFRNWMVETKTPEATPELTRNETDAGDAGASSAAPPPASLEASVPAPMDPFGVAPLPTEAPAATPTPAPVATPAPTPVPTPLEEIGVSEEPPTLHRIQVGDFEAREDADGRLEELSAQGYTQAEVVQDEDGIYHVQLQAFRKRKRAEAYVRKLATQGIDATIRP